MENLTLAEEVMLIGLDDESGGGKLRPGLDWAVAGAVLVDLRMAERIELDDDETVRVLSPTPVGVAYLDAELGKITAKGTAKAMKALRLSHRSAPDGAIETLIERGVLRRETQRVLGMLPVSRYPEDDATAETAVRNRLAAVVLDGQEPDERTAALVALLHAAKLWRQTFPSADRKQVKTRMKEIAEGQSVSPAVRKALQRTQAAMLASAAHGG